MLNKLRLQNSGAVKYRRIERISGETPKAYFDRRFAANVEFEPNTGCWLWSSKLGPTGYAEISVEGKKCRVIREIFRMNGQDPAGQIVLHNCDMPCCVNPAHLRLGSVKENSADMKARGRCASGFRRMRRSDKQFVISQPGLTDAAIARRLGFHPRSIGNFRRKNGLRSYRHEA